MRTAFHALRIFNLTDRKKRIIIKTMGEMNILTASIDGKLGEMYGVKQYGKHFAKAIPFSHTPFSAKQKKAFSNFALLNRFACGQWGAMKKYIRLVSGKMLPQNILAQEYKKMIQGAFFNLQNIYEVCDKLQSVEVLQAEYFEDEKKFIIKYTLEDTAEKGIPQETFLTCYDNEIYCLLQTQAEVGNHTLTFYTDREEIIRPYFIFTQYKKKKHGWKVVGALAVPIFKEPVIDGVWYTSNQGLQGQITVENGIMHAPKEVMRVENNTLIVSA